MRAHNRTLISKLGFADADKKDSRHDLACQFLADPACARQFIEKVYGPAIRYRQITQRLGFNGTVKHEILGVTGTTKEYALTKGKGDYKAVVGFLDVIILYKFVAIYDGVEPGCIKKGVDEPSPCGESRNDCCSMLRRREATPSHRPPVAATIPP